MNEDERSDIDQNARRRSRANFLLIAGIAFVPLMIAYLLFFYFPEYIPSGTTNKGTLIDPPANLEVLALDSGEWTLVVVAPTGCSEACERALYMARQIDIGLGKDARRVNRMLVVQEPPKGALAQRLAEEYPDVMVRESGVAVHERLSGLVPEGTLDGTILLSDPNGNLMMYYTSEHGGEDLRKDLKHLLRLSNIG